MSEYAVRRANEIRASIKSSEVDDPACLSIPRWVNTSLGGIYFPFSIGLAGLVMPNTMSFDLSGWIW